MEETSPYRFRSNEINEEEHLISKFGTLQLDKGETKFNKNGKPYDVIEKALTKHKRAPGEIIGDLADIYVDLVHLCDSQIKRKKSYRFLLECFINSWGVVGRYGEDDVLCFRVDSAVEVKTSGGTKTNHNCTGVLFLIFEYGNPVYKKSKSLLQTSDQPVYVSVFRGRNKGSNWDPKKVGPLCFVTTVTERRGRGRIT